MRIYISGPITGREEDARERFSACEDNLFRILGNDIEIINPYEIGQMAAMNAKLEHKDFMKISFALMDLCDAVFFLEGWEYSVGCNQEWIYAKNRHMKVVKE